MTAETEPHLSKAAKSLEAARILLHSDHDDAAASRAYYSMFHAVKALMAARGLSHKTHSAVHSAFAREFTLDGSMPQDFHKWLVDAWTDRVVGDYEAGTIVPHEAATTHIERAERILQAIRQHLDAN